MTVLNLADTLRVGTGAVDAVYAGSAKVWPTEAGGDWSPLDLGSKLLRWFSAENEAAYYANGASVTTLRDLSANAVNVTGLSGLTFNSSGGPGGGPYIQFGAAASIPLGALMNGRPAGEYAFTGRATGSGALAGLAKFGSGTGTGNRAHWNNASNVMSDDFGRGSLIFLFTDPAQYPLNTWVRYQVKSAASSWQSWLNGAPKAGAAGATAQWSGSQNFGASISSSTRYYQSPLGGLFIFGDELTTDERTAFDTWLAANMSGGLAA